jgi:AcrR family transcriptional regulator
MTLVGSEQVERRPGRPRSARADRAILQATVELLIEEGFQAMSIEGIAERAGVGKTTIYRRFDSKEEIVIAALATMTGEIRIPDTGDTRQDMLLLGEAFRSQAATSIVFPIMRQLISTALTNPAVFDAFKTTLMDPRQAAIRTILERGVARGDLRPDIDVELFVDTIPGAIFFPILFKLPPGSLPPADMPARLLNQLWQGIAAR